MNFDAGKMRRECELIGKFVKMPRWILRKLSVSFAPWDVNVAPPSRRAALATLKRVSVEMDYVKFGSTGLDVSRLCVGCMTYGIPDRGGHPWTLDEERSRPPIKQALELGVNFFDTANVYSDGTERPQCGEEHDRHRW